MGRSMITGGLGLVGRQLAKLLVDRGEEVVLLDVTPASILGQHLRERVEVIRSDITSWSQTMDAVKSSGVNTIYHVAAILPPSTENSPAVAYAVNVTGTYNVLEAARLFNVEKVIFSSSSAVWNSEVPNPISNEQAQFPVTMYGATKVTCERLGEFYAKHYSLDFRGVRLICIMGPGRVPGVGWTAYTSLVIEETAKGNAFTLRVKEDLLLHFIYLKDVAYALYDIANASRSRLTRCVYNIDGYSATTAQIVAATMKHNPNARIDYLFDPEYQRVMDTEYVNLAKRPDDSMARTEWGWAPHYNLDSAVADFIDDVKAGAVLTA